MNEFDARLPYVGQSHCTEQPCEGDAANLGSTLGSFRKIKDAQTALDEYSRTHRARSDHQSGPSRRALPQLCKKEERASQCLETLIEGTIHTASTKSALVRNAFVGCHSGGDFVARASMQLDTPAERHPMSIFPRHPLR